MYHLTLLPEERNRLLMALDKARLSYDQLAENSDLTASSRVHYAEQARRTAELYNKLSHQEPT